jgi:hypothetical protein
MPLTSKVIAGAILSQMAARRYTGRNAVDLANAVGSAVATYLVIPNLVTCTLAGTVGPVGSITSVAVAGLVPAAMGGFMLSKAGLKRLVGRDINGILSAISTGLVLSLSTMVLTGTAAGIALGAGTGKFTAVSDKVLSKLILAQMIRCKLVGRNNIDLADCIAFGLVKQLQTTAIFTVTVAGVVAPVPPVGPLAIAGVPSVFTKIS